MHLKCEPVKLRFDWSRYQGWEWSGFGYANGFLRYEKGLYSNTSDGVDYKISYSKYETNNYGNWIGCSWFRTDTEPVYIYNYLPYNDKVILAGIFPLSRQDFYAMEDGRYYDDYPVATPATYTNNSSMPPTTGTMLEMAVLAARWVRASAPPATAPEMVR